MSLFISIDQSKAYAGPFDGIDLFRCCETKRLIRRDLKCAKRNRRKGVERSMVNIDSFHFKLIWDIASFNIKRLLFLEKVSIKLGAKPEKLTHQESQYEPKNRE